MRDILLKPDRNRPRLEGDADLLKGCIDSLKKTTIYTNEQARILLIVPPYTRLQKSLQILLDNIKIQITATIYPIEDYENIVNELSSAGIYYIEEQKRAGIPMGLLRVGTAANKSGYDVKILDTVYEGRNQEVIYFQTQEKSNMLRYGLQDQEILKNIKEYRPHIVGITNNYTHQWGNAKHIIDLVKSFDKNIVVVVGGTHASSLSENILETSDVDYVVRGQSDKTFVELLNILTKPSKEKLSMENLPGISYREKGVTRKTDDIRFMKEIDSIAIPKLDLINLDIYSSVYHSAGKRKLKNGKILHGFTSIGCNSSCTFCTIPKIQGPWRSMSENKLDEYLQYIKSFRVNEILMEDDNLLSDPQWLLSVCKKLKEYNFAWVEEGGISLGNLIALLDNVSEEEIQGAHIGKKVLEAKRDGITAETLIKTMAESGCYSIYLAVETPHKESLNTSKKSILNADNDNTKKIIELFKKYNIKVTCGLMFGFVNVLPDGKLYIESREQIKQTFERAKEIKKIGSDYINFFIVTPLPGSKNFQELGNLVPENTDEAYSHEFGNISAPNGEWTKDELTLLRVKGIIETIGIDGYMQMINSGTRPI